MFCDTDERLPEALMDIIISWVDVGDEHDNLYFSIKKHIELHCAECKALTGKEEV